MFSHSREDIHLHESDFRLGSPTTEFSLYDDFEPSYPAQPDLNNDIPLPSVEQLEGFPNSISSEVAPHIRSPNDITEDVLISADPPTSFKNLLSLRRGKNLREVVS